MHAKGQGLLKIEVRTRKEQDSSCSFCLYLSSVNANLLGILSLRPPHPALSPNFGGEGRVRGSLVMLKK
jgi:hypothetical protein